MPTWRRIVEIHTGEQKNLFRTVRIDSPSHLSDDQRIGRWEDIIEEFYRRYETMVRFVPPRPDQWIPDIDDELEAETTWEWFDEEDQEF